MGDDWTDEELAEVLARAAANRTPSCEHEFGGWREHEDGLGGEQFCQKCGLGAMAWSLRFLP